jgi:hypothetical protein
MRMMFCADFQKHCLQCQAGRRLSSIAERGVAVTRGSAPRAPRSIFGKRKEQSQ